MRGALPHDFSRRAPGAASFFPFQGAQHARRVASSVVVPSLRRRRKPLDVHRPIDVLFIANSLWNSPLAILFSRLIATRSSGLFLSTFGKQLVTRVTALAAVFRYGNGCLADARMSEVNRREEAFDV
jgi:hypothetical protein